MFLHNGQHGRAIHITCTCSRWQSLQRTRGTCCSRQPLPNPSSSHTTTKAGDAPRRKSLQSTRAQRRRDISTTFMRRHQRGRCSMHVFNRTQRRQRCPLQRRQGERTMCDLRSRAISASWCCYFWPPLFDTLISGGFCGRGRRRRRKSVASSSSS